MSDLIHRDSDWAAFDGLMCRVDDFQPFYKGFGPRGILTLTCLEKRPQSPPFRASVLHKLDYENLCAAMIERGVADDEEAIIVWTKTYCYTYAKLFRAFMPRMVVMIFKKRSLQLLMDNSLEPELRGVERLKAELPVAEWKPPPSPRRTHRASLAGDFGDSSPKALIRQIAGPGLDHEDMVRRPRPPPPNSPKRRFQKPEGASSVASR